MTTPEREEQLEQWLRRQVRPAASEPTAACVDAETAAAWVDGALPRERLAPMQAHVAGCSRCQALMRTLVDMSASVPAEAAERQHAWWHAWLTWGAPLTVAAAALLAVAVWLRVPTPVADRGREVTAAATEARQAPGVADDVAPLTAPAAPLTPNVGSSLSLRERAPEPPPRERPGSEPTDTTPTSTGVAANRADSAPAETGASAESASRAASASAFDSAQVAPAPAAAPPAAARAVAAAPAQAAAPAAVAGLAAKSAGGTFTVSTGAERWRVGGARIEHSTDAGQTWATTSVEGPVILTAGAAPAPKTCWLVGRGGVVLLTLDGTTWRRLALGETVDLTGIVALNAQVAAVIAADGRRFETADSGRTWQQR